MKIGKRVEEQLEQHFMYYLLYFSSLAPIMFQHFQRSLWFYTHYWFMLQPADLKQNSIWWFNILCEMLHKHFKWLLRNGLL